MNRFGWIRSPWYDLGFLSAGPAILACLLYYPDRSSFGNSIPLLYAGLIVLFNHPHHYLTYKVLLPGKTKRLRYGPMLAGAGAAAALSVPVLLDPGSAAAKVVLVLVLNWNLWHILRQHAGILKIYDELQRRKNLVVPDWSSYLGPFLIALTALGVIRSVSSPGVWLELIPAKRFTFSGGAVLPEWVFFAALLPVVLFGVFLCWKVLKDPRFPMPQLILFLSAGVTFLVPLFVLPPGKLSLLIIGINLLHVIQYGAFVWLYERTREERSSVRMFVEALAYSAAIAVALKFLPSAGAAALFLFVTAGHNAVEFFLWRRSHNPGVAPFLDRLSGKEIIS